MIPLAQAWLSGKYRSSTKYDAELERHLALPTSYNKHTTPIMLDRLAERICFTTDIPSLLHEMEDNRQLTYPGILATTRLPYDCFWLEYRALTREMKPDHVVYFGALIRKIAGGKIRMIIVCGIHTKKHANDIIPGICYVIEFKQWPPIHHIEGKGKAFGFDVIYMFNRRTKADREGTIYPDAAIDLSWILTEIVFGIFLVTQPKCYKDEVCIASDKLQRRRRKAGKGALLEYRRINVHIGRQYSHYTRPKEGLMKKLHSGANTEGEAEVQHRRYHKVMGHFRHYVNTDNPRTIWIEPHFRGDPNLGVTFVERDVSR